MHSENAEQKNKNKTQIQTKKSNRRMRGTLPRTNLLLTNLPAFSNP